MCLYTTIIINLWVLSNIFYWVLCHYHSMLTIQLSNKLYYMCCCCKSAFKYSLNGLTAYFIHIRRIFLPIYDNVLLG